jgi:hypothetical protein
VKIPNAQRCFSHLHGNLLSLENGHFTLEVRTEFFSAPRNSALD